MRRWGWCLVVLAALGGAAAGTAEPAASPDPEQTLRDAGDAAAEVTVTRVFAGLGLTPQQAGRLLPVLEQAQVKLKEADEREAASVARLRTAAEDSRKRAVAGAAPSDAAERQYAAALQAAQKLKSTTRADQVALIKARLASLLSPEQMTALQEAAQTAAQQKARQQLLEQFATGEGGGGPLGMMARTLDRMRENPQVGAFPGLPGGPGGGPGGQGGPGGPGGGGGRGPGGRPGGPGGGPGGGFGPPGGGGGQDEAARQALRAQFEARQKEMQAFMERVRSMSPEEYAASKSDLALQFMQQQGRGVPGGRNPEARLDDFIADFLLQPAAPRAARRRAGAGS